jgi:tetratricopeptide (TPR) repeat protein
MSFGAPAWAGLGGGLGRVQDQPASVKQVLTPEEQKQRCEALGQQNQAASTAKEYSAVIDSIDRDLAAFQYLSSYEEYLATLAAYALTRRGELRMEVGFEFHVVGNAAPAASAFEQALTDFDAALERHPTQWKAHLNRGIVLGKQARWDDAAAAFQRSIEARPSQTHAYFNLAEIEYQRGQFEAALQNYDRVLETSSNDVQALNGRGLALLALGRGAEAVVVYQTLVGQQAGSAWLIANLADAHQAVGEWEAAETHYLRALELEQNSAIYRRLAWLYATCPADDFHRPDAALAVAKRAMSGAKQATAAHWDTLAAAQAANGSFAEAVDSLQQALKLAPQDSELTQRLASYQQQKPYLQVVRLAAEPSLLER